MNKRKSGLLFLAIPFVAFLFLCLSAIADFTSTNQEKAMYGFISDWASSVNTLGNNIYTTAATNGTNYATVNYYDALSTTSGKWYHFVVGQPASSTTWITIPLDIDGYNKATIQQYIFRQKAAIDTIAEVTTGTLASGSTTYGQSLSLYTSSIPQNILTGEVVDQRFFGLLGAGNSGISLATPTLYLPTFSSCISNVVDLGGAKALILSGSEYASATVHDATSIIFVSVSK